MRKTLVEKSSYGIVLFVVFAFLSFFFKPTSIMNTVEEGEATITSISLKREYSVSLKSPSRGYSDYYEIELFDAMGRTSSYVVEVGDVITAFAFGAEL